MNNISLQRYFFNKIIFAVFTAIFFLLTGYIVLENIRNNIDEDFKSIYTAKGYFTHPNEESKKLIKEAGGKIVTMDSRGQMIDSEEDISLDLNDFSDFINGEYVENDQKYSLTLTNLKDGYVGIVILPNEIIDSNVRISPPIEVERKYHWFIILEILIVIYGSLIPILILSKALKKSFDKPFSEIIAIFGQLEKGEYEFDIADENIEEYNNIKRALMSMAVKLKSLDEEKKSYAERQKQLFSDITHDIKTPITIIGGYADALLEGRSKDIEGSLKKIIDASNTIKNLTMKLSDILKYERSDYPLNLEKQDIVEILRREIILLFPLWEKKDMKVEWELSEDKIILDIDALLIRRLIHNLLKNTIDHNPPGTEVFIKVCKTEQEVFIIVADSGIAIPADMAKELFEPFFQTDKSRASYKNNSGLGLSIAKDIARLHGGKIAITRYENYSKAFIVEFPKE